MLRTIERFVSIEMHPSVYISFVAINLCLVFVYREFSLPVESTHHETVVVAAEDSVEPKLTTSLLPGDKGELPTMIQAMVKPQSERQKREAIIAKIENQNKGPNQHREPNQDRVPNQDKELNQHRELSQDKEPNQEPSEKSPSVKLPQARSSGAALAAVPGKVDKPRKKTKRSSRGLVPPPPPGVFVVPPPPDAPSLYSHLDAGSFMVAAPPPMVLDDSFSVSTQTRSHRGSIHNYGKRFGSERSKTVHNGNVQQVIVSR